MNHLVECDHLPEWATIEQACAWLETLFGPPWSLATLLEDGLRPLVWIDDCPPWVLGFASMLSGPEIQRLKVAGTVHMSRAESPDGAIHDFRPPRDFALNTLRFLRHDLVHFAETCGLPALPAHFAALPDSPRFAPSVEAAHGKRWTPELIAELKAFRAARGTAEAAQKYGVSTARIRTLDPSENPKPRGVSAFSQRVK